MDKWGLSDLDKKWRDNENVILIMGKIQGGSSENMCVGKRIEPVLKNKAGVYWF